MMANVMQTIGYIFTHLMVCLFVWKGGTWVFAR